jgi:hypothetical protein
VGRFAVVEEVARMMVVGKAPRRVVAPCPSPFGTPLSMTALHSSPVVDVSFQLSASPTSRQVFK